MAMALALTDDTSSTEALTRKLNEILSDADNDVGQFCFKEETIEEFMQELYKEIIAPAPTPTPTPNGSLVVQVDPPVESMQVNKDTKDEGVDLDDEWLTRVLNCGQGQAMDTSDWF